MKKLVIFLSAFSFLAACKSKENTGNTENPENKGGQMAVHTHESELSSAEPQKTTTIIWLDSTYRDVGKLKSGSDVEVTFRFKNAGNNPLVFSDVTAGCGCTVPEKPTEPYAPGQEGKIKAVFSSKGQSIGEHRKTVTVTANTTPNAIVQLTFRVEVIE